jgi:putative DNA methylase
MTWDYAETSVFSASAGNVSSGVEWAKKALDSFPTHGLVGRAEQADARLQTISSGKVVSTDPPYYDNIGYADLSISRCRAMRACFRSFCRSRAETEELVATLYRWR